MSPTATKIDGATLLSNELRDGLLQDLIAVGLILRRLEPAAADSARADLASAGAVIEEDVRLVRSLIDRLRAIEVDE